MYDLSHLTMDFVQAAAPGLNVFLFELKKKKKRRSSNVAS